MADPRTTGYLDDFQRANESPLSNGGMWLKSWTNVDYMVGLSNRACRVEPHSANTAMSHYTLDSWDGDVEVWGERVEGGFLLGHREILYIAVAGTMTGTYNPNHDGYLFYSHQQVGSNRHYLYRVTNGVLTELANAANDDDFVLLRTNGNYVETWASPTGGNDWSMILQVTDTTYRTGLYIGIGEADNNGSSSAQTGWVAVGGGHGGPVWTPKIIRRTHRRGGIWTP